MVYGIDRRDLGKFELRVVEKNGIKIFFDEKFTPAHI